MKIHYLTAVISLLIAQGCSGFMMQSNRESIITESLSPSTATVTFCGNAYMSKQEVEKLAMQRACELTIKKGYTHFVIKERNDHSEFCSLTDKPKTESSGPLASKRSEEIFSPQDLVRPNVALRISCYNTKEAPEGAINAQDYLDKNFPGLKFKE